MEAITGGGDSESLELVPVDPLEKRPYQHLSSACIQRLKQLLAMQMSAGEINRILREEALIAPTQRVTADHLYHYRHLPEVQELRRRYQEMAAEQGFGDLSRRIQFLSARLEEIERRLEERWPGKEDEDDLNGYVLQKVADRLVLTEEARKIVETLHKLTGGDVKVKVGVTVPDAGTGVEQKVTVETGLPQASSAVEAARRLVARAEERRKEREVNAGNSRA